MKKGQVYEAIVERVDFPNKGIVPTGEGTVIVKNSLPGQKIRFSINKVRKGKAEGRLLEVIEKSPLETGSPCSHFGVCGGCTYLSLPYEEQLQIKKQQVKKLLDSVLDRQDTEWKWEGIKASPVYYGYRNKMEFSFGDEIKDGPLALGMHKRGSFYDVVTVDDCKIVDADYRLILQTTLEYFAAKEVPYYHKMKQEGYLRHLLLRKASGTGEILVALVTSSQHEKDGHFSGETGQGTEEEKRISVEAGQGKLPDKESAEETQLLQGFLDTLLKLQEEGRLQGRYAGILHIVNDSKSDVVQSDRTDILYGQDYFYEELLGLKFKISTFSFFQTNSYSAEVLYETAREYVGALKGGVVFDLYSGTGTIAQLMAPVAEKVIGVEIVEEAVEAAKRNAAQNGLDNCEFIAGDVLKVLDGIKDKPDMIILDPPRDGIHPKALPKIIATIRAKTVIYISCKPTSLVRDLESFLAGGYVVEKACAVDQFPWTANVETVVLLSHKKPDGHINVKVEFGEGEGKVPLDNIAKRAEEYKPKERVTYKMIKEYIEAKYGFKVHTAYIAEVKRDLGLPMYDAPNAVEELKQPRKHPTAEKVEAIKDALKHFEVI